MKFSMKRDSSSNLVAMILSAILVALTVVIVYTFPKIVLGPWSGTLASHVPLLIAMFIHPLAAAAVAVAGSVAFFFSSLPPIIAMRALTHIVFVLVGCLLLRLGVNAYLTLILIAPIHAGMEALVVWLFVPGATFEVIFITTGLFTLIHHFIDCAIAIPVLKALQLTRMVPLTGLKSKFPGGSLGDAEK